MSDIVITGMGCVSAAGIGVEPFRASVFAGNSQVRELQGPRMEQLRIRRAAQVAPGLVDALLSEKELATTDPFSRYALVAAEEARAMAGLEMADIAGAGTAVVIGTGIGGETSHDTESYEVYANKAPRVDVMTIPRVMPSAAASQVSMRYGTTGPAFAVSSACASGTQAIGIGMQMVRHGMARRAVVGGAEALLTYSCMRAWEALRVMTPTLCRPFSRGRNGMVLGEGSAIFVLERAEDARARGAVPLAVLAGYGTTADGKDILRPDAEGCAQAMRLALADAGLSAGDLGYINAHGTGTILNDQAEAEAVRAVLGGHADDIPVSSTKPIHGHALGAAGALELLATVLAVNAQSVPPNINFIEPDPACALNIAREAHARPIAAAMSNSFAFGGINAALVVSRDGRA